MTRRDALLSVGTLRLLSAACEELQAEPSQETFPAVGWFRQASSILRVALTADRGYPQLPLSPEPCSRTLANVAGAGVSAIEVFAPSYGGKSFNGLDTKDYFIIDPKIGTMSDFRRLVSLTHRRKLAVTIFTNLGYSSVEAPFFLKACDEIRQGHDAGEARWFLWSNSVDAPPPGRNDSYFMVCPTRLPQYDARKSEVWVWSERAQHYYWSKWSGCDDQGKSVRLPQFNWGAPEWQQEAKRIVDFWMNTGIDGIVVDAVNWYANITWSLVRNCITDIIRAHVGYAQPEGGGGFYEDPVAWITEGGFNSVTDYGLGIWWERTNVIRSAIEACDARVIESALRGYHDRVVEAGGVLYFPPPVLSDVARTHLALALVAWLADLVLFDEKGALDLDTESRHILAAKDRHPALQQAALRRQLPMPRDASHYAVLLSDAATALRALAVFNLKASPQDIRIEVSGVAQGDLRRMRDGRTLSWQNPLLLNLPAYGFEVLELSADRSVISEKANHVSHSLM